MKSHCTIRKSIKGLAPITQWWHFCNTTWWEQHKPSWNNYIQYYFTFILICSSKIKMQKSKSSDILIICKILTRNYFPQYSIYKLTIMTDSFSSVYIKLATHIYWVISYRTCWYILHSDGSSNVSVVSGPPPPPLQIHMHSSNFGYFWQNF